MRERHEVRIGGLILLLLMGAIAFGCKAKPSEEPSDFVGDDHEFDETHEMYPFHRIWLDESWNDPEIKTLVVAPVNVDNVKKATWWTKANLKGHNLEEVLQKLAVWTQEKFQEKFRKDKEHRFEVVDTPQDDSYIVELALVEVVPNKASLGALGLAATVVAAPLGAGIAAKETAKGKVAIEGRWRRASDDFIVAEFTDREHGKFGPINLRRATWYGHAHGIIGEWAEQWVEIANSGERKKIKDTRTWTLMPW